MVNLLGRNPRFEFCGPPGFKRLEPTKNSLFLDPSHYPSLIDTIYQCALPSHYMLTLVDSAFPLVPATRNGDEAPVIAPGAENVGQAQILSEFSQPFTLDGFFGAADAGVFGNRVNDDVPMGADEDGDVFWDAVEGTEPMDEDGWVFFSVGTFFSLPGLFPTLRIAMESDDLVHVVPRKRSRSPSVVPPVPDISTASVEMPFSQADTLTWQSRQPKRQRKNKDVPAYDAPPDRHILQQMGKSNPLSRKALKKDAKRARKAHRADAGAAPSSGGMDVDGESLEFSFMA